MLTIISFFILGTWTGFLGLINHDGSRFKAQAINEARRGVCLPEATENLQPVVFSEGRPSTESLSDALKNLWNEILFGL